VREAGLEPFIASGAAERHAWVADLADGGLFSKNRPYRLARSPGWRDEADRMLDHLGAAKHD